MLVPRNDQLAKLQRYISDSSFILKTTGDRYLWDRYQEDKRAEEGQPKTAQQQAPLDEQMQVDQQIDWYEFVVVEKIDLYDDEEMKMIEEAEAEEELRRIEEQQRQIR